MYMFEDTKKAWVTALTDGTYQHGKGRLRNDHNEFTALGVLCDLHHKTVPFAPDWIKVGPDACHHYEYDGSFQLLPQSVVNWSGILCRDGRSPSLTFIPYVDHVYIDWCSDNHGFKTVAQYISLRVVGYPRDTKPLRCPSCDRPYETVGAPLGLENAHTQQ